MIIPSAQVAELTDSEDGDASEWAKDAVTDDTVEILLSKQIKAALALKDEKGVKPASGRAPAAVGDTAQRLPEVGCLRAKTPGFFVMKVQQLPPRAYSGYAMN